MANERYRQREVLAETTEQGCQSTKPKYFNVSQAVCWVQSSMRSFHKVARKAIEDIQVVNTKLNRNIKINNKETNKETNKEIIIQQTKKERNK
jgi:Ribonuclease G/E